MKKLARAMLLTLAVVATSGWIHAQVITLPSVSRLEIGLRPGETLRTSFWPEGSRAFEGWAQFDWEGKASVDASVELTLIKGNPPTLCDPPTPLRDRPVGEIEATTIIPAVRKGFEVHVPALRGTFRETAFSMINLGSEIPSLKLRFLDTSSVIITSDRPIAVSAVDVLLPDLRFVHVPGRVSPTGDPTGIP